MRYYWDLHDYLHYFFFFWGGLLVIAIVQFPPKPYSNFKAPRLGCLGCCGEKMTLGDLIP